MTKCYCFQILKCCSNGVQYVQTLFIFIYYLFSRERFLIDINTRIAILPIDQGQIMYAMMGPTLHLNYYTGAYQYQYHMEETI